MEKEAKLVKKVKRFLKRLGFPRWLHHFGPKKYELYVIICCLLVKWYSKLSYRRAVKILDLLGFLCPSKSTLQYNTKKLKKEFWDKILRATSGDAYIVALDSTGFSRENPSYHYLRRIDGKMPKIPVKLSCSLNTRNKKFCSATIRVLPAHDIRDAEPLLKRIHPYIVVADKAYSSEKLYAFCENNNIILMSPKKKKTFRGHCRRRMQKKFRERTYHRRSIIEAGFSALKRKFGGSVSSKKIATIRSEVYGRLTCHNLFYFNFELLGQSQMIA